MKNRIKYIDIARAIAIFLIVFGHTIVHNTNSYWLFKLIYSFHVVLFFIISGYTYNENKKRAEFIKKKFLGLMIPYFIFSILFIIPYIMFGSDVNKSIGTSGKFDILQLFREILYGVGYNGALRQNTSLWFLPALFSTEVIFRCIGVVSIKKINVYCKLAILILISFIFSNFKIVLPWGISSAIVLMPFFFLGYLFKEKKIIDHIKITKWKIIPVIILVIVSIVIAELNETVSCVNYDYGNYLMFITTSCIFSLVIIIGAKIIGSNKFLETVGKDTMSILIFHKLIVLIFQTKIPITRKILLSGNWLLCTCTALVITILSIFVCIIIGKLVRKYMPFLYGIGKKTIKNNEKLIEE